MCFLSQTKNVNLGELITLSCPQVWVMVWTLVCLSLSGRVMNVHPVQHAHRLSPSDPRRPAPHDSARRRKWMDWINGLKSKKEEKRNEQTKEYLAFGCTSVVVFLFCSFISSWIYKLTKLSGLYFFAHK